MRSHSIKCVDLLSTSGSSGGFLPGRKNAGTIGRAVVEDVGGQTDDNNEHCDLRGCASRPIGRFSPPPRIRPRAVSEHADRGLYRRCRLRTEQCTIRAANHLRLTLSVIATSRLGDVSIMVRMISFFFTSCSFRVILFSALIL